MATRSFTNDYSFNRKNANALIYALNNDNNPKLSKLPKVNQITDLNVIENIFFKKEKNK